MDLDIDEKKLSCSHGYCTGKVGDLADPSLHVKTQDYKRKTSGRMKALSGEDIYKIPKARGYFVSRKYDGEFALIFFNGENLISVNPGGTVRIGLPCFDEAEELLKKAKVKSCILAGEIYFKEKASKANLVQQVVRVLRSPTSKAQLEQTRTGRIRHRSVERRTGRRRPPRSLNFSINGSIRARPSTSSTTKRPTRSTRYLSFLRDG